MNDWEVGLSTGCFYKTSIFDCLEAVHDAGFTQIEICSYPAHLDYHDAKSVRKAHVLLQRLGLTAFSFHAPYGEGLDISSPDRKIRETALQKIEQAARAAAVLEVRCFVIHPGPDIEKKVPAAEYLQRLDTAARSLDRISVQCEILGLKPLLENMLPHLIFGGIPSLLYLFGEVRTRDLSICLDTGHANCTGDPRHALHRLSGHIELVHANDNFARGDNHLPPGMGNIDWTATLKDLAATGFRGMLMLELAGDTGKGQGNLLGEAGRARRYLNERYPRTSP